MPAPVKQACVLFGERLEGLRRAGVPVDRFPTSDGASSSSRRPRQPVLWEAWETSCGAWRRRPHGRGCYRRRNGLGETPAGWREHVGRGVGEAPARLYGPGDDRLFRFSMGLAMRELRGKVPALEVADAVDGAIARSAIEHAQRDAAQGI